MSAPKGFDWSRVNFRRHSNKWLAKYYGVSPATVSQARKRHAPETLRKEIHGNPVYAERERREKIIYAELLDTDES